MKTAIRAFISGVVFTTMVGCAHMAPPPAKFDVVALPGTGDSQDLLRALAQGYTVRYPERQVMVPDSIGSDGGVRVVGTGESPIGRVARLPNPEERAQYGALHYLEFARVPVAFVVTAQAGVRNLSEQQVCDIYSGRLTNWKDVGGNDLLIDVQARPEDGSNMRTIRKHLACFSKLDITPQAHFNLRNADLVNSMRTSAGAIGFMPLSEAQLHSYPPVALDGVAPSEPHYKLGIGLGFVYKDPLSPSIQAFIDYLKTKPAQKIMHQTGHVPVQG
jgi:phosphate transport system substrate-binding protein